MDETRRRIDLAQELVLAYRREMGEHVVAAACYGSVAHGRADAHSDLELIVLTDTAIEAVNVHMVRQGIQVECDVLPTERLRHAAQVVTIEWGVQADCYRYHWVFGIPRNNLPLYGRPPWRRRANDSRTRYSKVGGRHENGLARW